MGRSRRGWCSAAIPATIRPAAIRVTLFLARRLRTISTVRRPADATVTIAAGSPIPGFPGHWPRKLGYDRLRKTPITA